MFIEFNIKCHFVAKHKDFVQQFSTQRAVNQGLRYGQKVKTASSAHSSQVLIYPKGCYKGKFCFITQDCKRLPAFF